MVGARIDTILEKGLELKDLLAEAYLGILHKLNLRSKIASALHVCTLDRCIQSVLFMLTYTFRPSNKRNINRSSFIQLILFVIIGH